MRLVGYSNWQASDISVYVADSALRDDVRGDVNRLHDAIAHHVTVLFRHIFLSRKPSRPSQSRWTGVASVANFALSLALCHGLLKPLFESLSGKDDKISSMQQHSTDADAGASAIVGSGHWLAAVLSC